MGKGTQSYSPTCGSQAHSKWYVQASLIARNRGCKGDTYALGQDHASLKHLKWYQGARNYVTSQRSEAGSWVSPSINYAWWSWRGEIK